MPDKAAAKPRAARHLALAALSAVWLMGLAIPSHAQQQGDSQGQAPAQNQSQSQSQTRPEGYAITGAAERPQGDPAYVALARSKRLGADVVYATGVDGQLSTGQERKAKIASPRNRDVSFGNGGVVMAVLILALGLFLLLRFGSGGALVARAPQDGEGQGHVPDGWALKSPAGADDPAGLLARLRAMPDRAEAMVELLRHCLLSGGAATETRFARSDTERRAFGRLPSSYRHHRPLSQLLRATELAHYGGRPVTDDGFEAALSAGAAILMPAGAGGATHG